jgi:hypothetical protein
LLVGFCHTKDPAAASRAGNLSCDTLEMLPHPDDDNEQQHSDKVQEPQREPVARVWEQVLPTSAVRQLRLDAIQLDASALGESYWLSATATPRTAIEAFALKVLALHLPDAVVVNGAGVEYWVQHLHRSRQRPDQGPKGHEEQAQEQEDGCYLPFHFDKDEAVLRSDGAWRHPICATVTYLTTAGPGDTPTVVFDTIHPEAEAQRQLRHHGRNTPAAAAVPKQQHGPSQACISYPREGKHLAFRGKYLHGCPLELAIPAADEQHMDRPGKDGAEVGRVTLLVNVWRRQPAEVAALPASIADTLSPAPPADAPWAPLLAASVGQDNEERPRRWAAVQGERGGSGPTVRLREHCDGMTAGLPMAAVAVAHAESVCLCTFSRQR